MQQRYDIRREEDGTWTVFDIFTGLPVAIGDDLLSGLDAEEADDPVDILNLADIRRRATET